MVAHILVQTEGRRDRRRGRRSRLDQGRVAAKAVTGPYDLIGKAEATSLDDLGRRVIQPIQSVARPAEP